MLESEAESWAQKYDFLATLKKHVFDPQFYSSVELSTGLILQETQSLSVMQSRF